MITEKELNPKGYKLTPELSQNFFFHYYAMNEFRVAYAKTMIVSSGIRSEQDQIDIYNAINRIRISHGKPPIPVKIRSWHLFGAATDFIDVNCDIYHFCLYNISLLERLNIYVEDNRYTIGWVHLQTKNPPSQNRIFIPY